MRDLHLWVDSDGFMHAVWTEQEPEENWNIHYGRQLEGGLTATPTATLTPTTEPTIPSPTPQPTLTDTMTPAATLTATPTMTPTATLTATATPTATVLPVASPTSTPSTTPTAEPTPTVTPSVIEPVDVWFFPLMLGSVPQGPPLKVTPLPPPEVKAPEPPTKRKAGATVMQWSWTEPINLSQPDAQSGLLSGVLSRAPAIGVAPDGKVHVVWEEGTAIYHRYQDQAGWSTAGRVATGERPALAFCPSGALHLAFANEFGGNMEIYHVRWTPASSWSLPTNVSATSGASSNPDVAVAPDGTINIVWADTTPGHSVIYRGYGTGLQWSTWPIPDASGSQPSIAIDSAGTVKVAWQDRYDADEPYEIYFSQRESSTWSLPVCVDDTVNTDSVSCDLIVGPGNRGHIVWQEDVDGPKQVHYCEQNQAMWWVAPIVLSAPAKDAQLPAVGIGPLGDVHVAWDESVRASYRRFSSADSEWAPIGTVSSHAGGIADVAISTSGQRESHLVWTQNVGGDDWDIFYSRQIVSLPHRLYVALTFSE